MASDRPDQLPKLYTQLADWWPLLSSPEDYAPEAKLYHQALMQACTKRPVKVLELGSGGGNNASHLKAHFNLTLVDRSEGMLAISRALNPECEHILGDMRTVRLDQLFDAVFVHDSIMYMTSAQDLHQVVETAYVHCKIGGAALFVPDCVRETFQPYTSHGGHDGLSRSLRYLMWIYDPDPADSTYLAEFAYLLHDERGSYLEHDLHLFGLFSTTDWMNTIASVGFTPRKIQFNLPDAEGGWGTAFLGLRSGNTGQVHTLNTRNRNT
ncbi:MAG: class I SAM-dependent methyltransferase [Anaerolineales bacterium]|nr:MAG: class I SAM-dependent methyltransferase [Anaerolineales bacterium]